METGGSGGSRDGNCGFEISDFRAGNFNHGWTRIKELNRRGRTNVFMRVDANFLGADQNRICNGWPLIYDALRGRFTRYGQPIKKLPVRWRRWFCWLILLTGRCRWRFPSFLDVTFSSGSVSTSSNMSLVSIVISNPSSSGILYYVGDAQFKSNGFWEEFRYSRGLTFRPLAAGRSATNVVTVPAGMEKREFRCCGVSCMRRSRIRCRRCGRMRWQISGCTIHADEGLCIRIL